jgi:hypothetical protein
MQSMPRFPIQLLLPAWLFFFHLTAGAAVPGRPDRAQIVFGYMQSIAPDGPVTGYRWHALTHIGYTFVRFRADGSLDPASRENFRNRPGALKNGGAAKNNGVKVIAVLANHGFQADVEDAVFPSAIKRAKLIAEVVALAGDPVAGCDGVSLDIEPMNFKRGTAVAFNSFVLELSAALRRMRPAREFSMYVGSYYPARYSIATFRSCFDYLLFSAYNFAPGNVVGDVGFVDGIHKGIDGWLKAGMPPEKIILTLPLFGKEWEAPAAAWGVKGHDPKSIGMDYGNLLTTTRVPPLTANPSGAKRSCVWTAEDAGAGKFRIRTFDDLEAHERKLRMALSWDGTVSPGARLGGVGFWSLMWLAQGLRPGSVDPNDGAHAVNPALRRTFGGPWTLWEELFAPPSQKVYRAETFEGATLDPMWAGPASSPDSAGIGKCAMLSAAAAPGSSKANARVASLQFSFTGGAGRAVYKYRPLADVKAPYPVDRNAALVLTDAATRFIVPVYVPEAMTGVSLRLLVSDKNGELEQSLAFPLAKSGWQTVEWNLADPKTVAACTTKEGGLRSGDGVIQTAGGGARDIAFIGFAVESASPAPVAGRVDVDQILYARGAN